MNDNDTQVIEEEQIFDNLLLEFVEQRNAIKKMIEELEAIKDKIDSLFGNSLDKRYLRFFEEKVKTATELFKIILEMRKEIIKTTKDEIELRRKIKTKLIDPDDIENIFDIRKMAEKVEKLNKKAKELKVQKPQLIHEKEGDRANG